MAKQRDHRDLDLEAVDELDPLKAIPRLSCLGVLGPAWPVIPLPEAIAQAGSERPSAHDIQFGCVQMDLCVRKVGEPAGMVQVKVGHQNMAHVARVIAEPADLRERCFSRFQARGEQEPRRPQAGWRSDVSCAEAGVDEDQSGRVLDEDATRDQVSLIAIDEPESGRRMRAHRPAVEMMNHGSNHSLLT
jgi:hypothetical protein